MEAEVVNKVIRIQFGQKCMVVEWAQPCFSRTILPYNSIGLVCESGTEVNLYSKNDHLTVYIQSENTEIYIDGVRASLDELMDRIYRVLEDM